MDETMDTKSDISKSWVLVNTARSNNDETTHTSQVEDLKPTVEDSHEDSDTDSISVISESGGSCHSKSDEDILPRYTEDEEEIYDEEIQDIEGGMVEPLCDNYGEEEQDYNRILFLQSLFVGAFLVAISFACQHFLQLPACLDDFIEEYNQGNVVTYCIHGHSNEEYVEPINFEQCVNDNNYDLNEIAQHKAKKKSEGAYGYNKEIEELVGNSRKYQPTATVIEDSPKKVELPQKDETQNRDSCKINSDDGENKKKFEELKAKEEYLQNKEKFLIEKEHDLIKKEMKIKNEKNNCEKNKKYKNEKYDENNNKEKFSEESKKSDNRFKPVKRNHQQKGETHEKFHKIKDKSEENRKRSKFDKSQKRNLTGQWYINMSKARHDIRKKERAGDWMFDRAHERNMKRNKARWYFQWMLDRERLRAN